MTQPLILVLDADAQIRRAASAAFGAAGYDVVAAATLADGLAALSTHTVDLVLLDGSLPGAVGSTGCAALRAASGGAALPVIVSCAGDDVAAIALAYASGANDFVARPVAWEVLVYRVQHALQTSRALQDAVRQGALLQRSQRLAQMGSWEWNCLDGRVQCSDELHRIEGTPEGAGTPPGLPGLLRNVHPDDRLNLEQLLAFAQTEARAYEVELRILHADGGVRRVFEQTDVECNAAGEVLSVRGIRRDVTQQVEANDRIRTLAYFDGLTGLPNRSLFQEMASQWLPFAQRRGLQCAVLFIALDRFKLINETLGPTVGDAALALVGDRLRDGVRAGDVAGVASPGRRPAAVTHALVSTGSGEHDPADAEDLLARMGGDEFTLLLVDVAGQEGAAVVARRLMRALAEPMRVAGHDLSLTASIGIALAPHDGSTADALVRNASAAMHIAKEDGRNQMRFYLASMGTDMQRRLTLENDLRRALDRGEFSVHYQAKVDARNSEITGAEALLRWQHPTRGPVSPVEFIPVAEESGLIVPITDWVVARVCRQLAEWRADGVEVVPVSVNLDGKSMQNERLLENIGRAMAEHGVRPQELEFEVTESGLMRDLDRASELLQQLKALGVALSIDDFGTGYSSLTYLKRFPVDVLKIDRSFVKDLMTDANDAALTSAIIAMGLSLNLKLVAEGVETWPQADFLVRRGCHCVQGFLFAKPLPADDFATLLLEGLPTREVELAA